jgi:hypothetical protein
MSKIICRYLLMLGNGKVYSDRILLVDRFMIIAIADYGD